MVLGLGLEILRMTFCPGASSVSTVTFVAWMGCTGMGSEQ